MQLFRVWSCWQITNLLTMEEIRRLNPTLWFVPRTFILKPGHSLLLGGLARVDYLEVWWNAACCKAIQLDLLFNTQVHVSKKTVRLLLMATWLRNTQNLENEIFPTSGSSSALPTQLNFVLKRLRKIQKEAFSHLIRKFLFCCGLTTRNLIWNNNTWL